MADNERQTMTVTVLPSNSRPVEVEVEKGSTVRDVLQAGSIPLSKAEAVRMGSDQVSLDTTIDDEEQAVLSIAPDVSGGLC